RGRHRLHPPVPVGARLTVVPDVGLVTGTVGEVTGAVVPEPIVHDRVHREGSSGDGLRLERRHRPRRGDLADPVDVVLQPSRATTFSMHPSAPPQDARSNSIDPRAYENPSPQIPSASGMKTRAPSSAYVRNRSSLGEPHVWPPTRSPAASRIAYASPLARTTHVSPRGIAPTNAPVTAPPIQIRTRRACALRWTRARSVVSATRTFFGSDGVWTAVPR